MPSKPELEDALAAMDAVAPEGLEAVRAVLVRMLESCIVVTSDGPLHETLDAALATYLRTNGARRDHGAPVVRPLRVTIECEAVNPDPRTAELLRAAERACFRVRGTFSTPAEVHAWFSRDSLRLALGEVAPDYDEAELEEIAEAVIRTRSHCDF